MRFLAVGVASAIASAAITAGVFLAFVDRQQGPSVDPAEPVLVYVAKERIAKGTRITRNDLYAVTSIPRKDVEPGRIPAHPYVGAVATRDIRPGDQYTFGDYRYRP